MRSRSGRSGGYRLMLGDAYAFRKSILPDHRACADRQRHGHGLRGSDVSLSRPPSSVAGTLPPVADRRVVDPTRIIFKPAWAVPIRSFTFRNATLTKMDEDIGGQKISFLRMQSGDKRLVR